MRRKRKNEKERKREEKKQVPSINQNTERSFANENASGKRQGKGVFAADDIFEVFTRPL